MSSHQHSHSSNSHGHHAHHHGKAPHEPPMTVTGEEGTAKRNILRHGGGGKGSRKDGSAGVHLDDDDVSHLC